MDDDDYSSSLVYLPLQVPMKARRWKERAENMFWDPIVSVVTGRKEVDCWYLTLTGESISWGDVRETPQRLAGSALWEVLMLVNGAWVQAYA